MIIWEIVWAFVQKFWPWLLGAVALAVGVWGWNAYVWDPYVKDPYIADGKALEHVQTAKETARAVAAESANASLAMERDTLKQQLADLRTADAAEVQRITDAKAKNEAESKAKITMLLDNTARLAAIAAGPPAPTKKEACDEADQLLDDYSARRLRD